MDEFTRLKNLKKVRHRRWFPFVLMKWLDCDNCFLCCTPQTSNYEIKKKRCKYLRSKLSHIKRKISEYDRRPWTFTSAHLVLGKRQFCTVPRRWIFKPMCDTKRIVNLLTLCYCISQLRCLPKETAWRKWTFLNCCLCSLPQSLWVEWRNMLVYKMCFLYFFTEVRRWEKGYEMNFNTLITFIKQLLCHF